MLECRDPFGPEMVSRQLLFVSNSESLKSLNFTDFQILALQIPKLLSLRNNCTLQHPHTLQTPDYALLRHQFHVIEAYIKLIFKYINLKNR